MTIKQLTLLTLLVLTTSSLAHANTRAELAELLAKQRNASAAHTPVRPCNNNQK